MTTNALITTGDTTTIAIDITAEAAALRDRLLEASAGITTVTDSLDYGIAVDLAKELKTTLRAIEDARKTAKEPLIILAKRIQDTAAEFSKPLAEQHHRIGQLILSYEDAERRRREEAERKAREETYRIARETAAKAEAAAAQAAAQAAAAGENPHTAATAAANAIQDAAAKQAAEVQQQLANTTTPKATGVRRTKTLHFEITDEPALRAARPDLYSPDDTKIRAAIKITRDIPGLKIWEETKL